MGRKPDEYHIARLVKDTNIKEEEIEELYKAKSGEFCFKGTCSVCEHIWKGGYRDLKKSEGCYVCKNSRNQQILIKEKVSLAVKHNSKLQKIVIKDFYINKYSQIALKCICKQCNTNWSTRLDDFIISKDCPTCHDNIGALNNTTVQKNKEFYRATEAFLYLIHCEGKEETFLKIGITSTGVRIRYQSKKSMPYNYTLIENIPMNMYDAFYKEQEIKDSLSEYRHYPKILFGGHTEALHIDCKDMIIKQLKENKCQQDKE